LRRAACRPCSRCCSRALLLRPGRRCLSLRPTLLLLLLLLLLLAPLLLLFLALCLLRRYPVPLPLLRLLPLPHLPHHIRLERLPLQAHSTSSAACAG
jgi:hypothetical protein